MTYDFIGSFLAYGIHLPEEIFEEFFEGDETVVYEKDGNKILMKIYGTDDYPKYFGYVDKVFRSGGFTEIDGITLDQMKEVQKDGYEDLFKSFSKNYELDCEEPKWHCLFALGDIM